MEIILKKRSITIKGSCHCQAVKFSLKTKTPYPYQRCYCSICRKSQGGGGYAINIGGDAKSMKISGQKHIAKYRARLKPPGAKRAHHSTAERHFCKLCGSALWLFSPEYPDLIHPFASAIDTALPEPPESTHLMLDYIAPWVVPQLGRRDKKFGEYPKESIQDWHDRLGV